MEDKKSPPQHAVVGHARRAGPVRREDLRQRSPQRRSPPRPRPAAAPGENKYTQWYEVKSGDTLWKIAKEHYGDGSLYTEIFKANQDVLTDPDKIKVGQKLRIP